MLSFADVDVDVVGTPKVVNLSGAGLGHVTPPSFFVLNNMNFEGLMRKLSDKFCIKKYFRIRST